MGEKNITCSTLQNQPTDLRGFVEARQDSAQGEPGEADGLVGFGLPRTEGGQRDEKGRIGLSWEAPNTEDIWSSRTSLECSKAA